MTDILQGQHRGKEARESARRYNISCDRSVKMCGTVTEKLKSQMGIKMGVAQKEKKRWRKVAKEKLSRGRSSNKIAGNQSRFGSVRRQSDSYRLHCQFQTLGAWRDSPLNKRPVNFDSLKDWLCAMQKVSISTFISRTWVPEVSYSTTSQKTEQVVWGRNTV